jgi:hypothetical protein
MCVEKLNLYVDLKIIQKKRIKRSSFKSGERG